MTPKQFSKKLNDIQKKYEKNFKEIVQVAKSPQFLQPIAVIAADLSRSNADPQRIKVFRVGFEFVGY